MTPLRIAARRPVFHCLNAPIPRPQLRHIAQRQGPKSLEDHVSVHRAEAIRRAKAIRKRNWLAAGAALSMIAPIFLVRLWDLPPPDQGPNVVKTDSPRAATEEFQGKKVVIAPGDKVIAAPLSSEHPTATDVDTIELVPTGTSYVPYFPKTISLPGSSTTGPEAITSSSEYTLLGLGIRRVSFLSVQVYVVGLYVRTAHLHKLQNELINTVNPSASALIPGEKDALRKALVDPKRSVEVWDKILSQEGSAAVDMAFRIVPTRGTDFKHLQDGWMRGMMSRTDDVRRRQADLLRKQAVEQGKLALPAPVAESEFDDESFGLAMKDFKNLFQGRGKAPKGSVVILNRREDRALEALFQPIIKTKEGEKMGEITSLGAVKDERVSRLVWLLYLGGEHVSSEEARKSVVEGCLGIVERPVGTVEGMVS